MTARKPEIAEPFCLRLYPSEKTRLKELAGSQPLGVYIRDRLFGEDAPRRRRRRAPSVDDQAAARLLGALGQSRLSSNMNQIAKAANVGALPVTEELEEDLRCACAAIYAMRETLMLALGLKSTGEDS